MKKKLFVPILIYTIMAGIALFNGCIPKAEVLPKYGSLSFYTNYNDYLGQFTVTVDGNNINTISSTSSDCGSYSYNSSNLFELTEGNHNYVAQTVDKSRIWSGSANVSANGCNSIALYASTSTLLGTSTSTSSGVIIDPYGIRIDLKWSVSPYYAYAYYYATFDLAVSTYYIYNYSNVYSSSTYTNSFQTAYLPYSGSLSSNLADGTYYVHVQPYTFMNPYTGKFNLLFTGQSTNSTYPLNSTINYSSYQSYITFAKIAKLGNSYTISLY